MRPNRLNAHHETVEDMTKTLGSLMQEALSTAILLASTHDYSLIAGDLGADKAKPVVGTVTKASLQDKTKQMQDKMKGGALFSAFAKQAVAVDVAMPVSLLMGVHGILMQAAEFACSFSKNAAKAWEANAVAITKENEELEKTVNHRGDNISVYEATSMLLGLQSTLAHKVEAALTKAGKRQETALLMMRAGDGKRTTRQTYTEDTYTARSTFKKVGNRHQERADLAEKGRNLIDALVAAPGDENLAKRKNILSRGLCKWHYLGGESCRQMERCRFAHLDQDELKEIGVERAEVIAAFPPPRN